MTYVAFLRGINVGGNSVVSMATIRNAVEGLGFAGVRTYINSGNVIFSTAKSDPEKLAHAVERALDEATGLPIRVLVLSAAALKKIAAAIPATWVNDKEMRCEVLLLWKAADHRKVVGELPANPEVDEIKYTPGAVIWRIDRKNVGRSRMNRNIGTPLYKKMTGRNVNTIRKLVELASQTRADC